MKASYCNMKALLSAVLNDFRVLAGDKLGPSESSWQDIAGLCARRLWRLADQLEQARQGNAEAFLAFPSPDDND